MIVSPDIDRGTPTEEIPLVVLDGPLTPTDFVASLRNPGTDTGGSKTEHCNQIVSLAFVDSLVPDVDGAGRPEILFELRYA